MKTTEFRGWLEPTHQHNIAHIVPRTVTAGKQTLVD